MRIQQEALLGIAGVRALRALKLTPGTYHLNEGHCAFAVPELVREACEAGQPYSEAFEAVQQRCVFTITPPCPRATIDSIGTSSTTRSARGASTRPFPRDC